MKVLKMVDNFKNSLRQTRTSVMLNDRIFILRDCIEVINHRSPPHLSTLIQKRMGMLTNMVLFNSSEKQNALSSIQKNIFDCECLFYINISLQGKASIPRSSVICTQPFREKYTGAVYFCHNDHLRDRQRDLQTALLVQPAYCQMLHSYILDWPSLFVDLFTLSGKTPKIFQGEQEQAFIIKFII